MKKGGWTTNCYFELFCKFNIAFKGSQPALHYATESLKTTNESNGEIVENRFKDKIAQLFAPNTKNACEPVQTTRPRLWIRDKHRMLVHQLKNEKRSCHKT